MKKVIISLFILFAVSVLSGQEANLWNNIRNSAYTQDNQMYIRCETIDLPNAQTELYYLSDNEWEFAELTQLDGVTYEAVVSGNPQEDLYCRYRTEADTIITMMAAFVPNDDFPVQLSQLGFVVEDAIGDNLEGEENLDLTSEYFGYSDSRFYAAMTNNSDDFPTDNGGWFPDEYYFYIAGIINPETVMQDTVMYGMVYCNIPFLAEPGLYKISGDTLNLDTIERIGDIEYEIDDNQLIMACNIEDLTSDENFGDWPNLSNSIGLQSMTNLFSAGSQEFGFADLVNVSFQKFDQYVVEAFENELPQISEVSFTNLGILTNISCTYFDANANFPLVAEVETHHSDGSIETYELSHISVDFSAPVNYSVQIPETDWTEFVIRFSDNGYQYSEQTVQNTSAEETTLSQNRLSIFPNPFRNSTTISFELSTQQNRQNERNTISVYNIKGQKVKEFVILSGVEGNNSQFSIIWDGKDEKGKPLDSGIYLLNLHQDNKTTTKRIMLLK